MQPQTSWRVVGMTCVKCITLGGHGAHVSEVEASTLTRTLRLLLTRPPSSAVLQDHTYALPAVLTAATCTTRGAFQRPHPIAERFFAGVWCLDQKDLADTQRIKPLRPMTGQSQLPQDPASCCVENVHL